MKFDFTKCEFDYFIEHAGFTDQEITILNYKRKGWYNLEIAVQMDYSEATILRRVKSIKKKIIKVINETPYD